MSDFAEALPHGPIVEVFPEVFFVTGWKVQSPYASSLQLRLMT